MANIVNILVHATNDTEKAFSDVNKSFGKMRNNLIAMAASLGPQMFGPLVAGAGAAVSALASAGLATAAFGAAVVPQLSAVKKASEAYTKVLTAQDKAARMTADAHALAANGGKAYHSALTRAASASRAAKDAQDAYNQSLKSMPAATRATAESFAKLKDSFKKWSDSLAPTTMPIFTKGLNVIRGLLPTMTPLVKTAADAFGHMMDSIGGGAKSAGFRNWLSDMNSAAKNTLPKLLSSLGNISVGLGGMFQGFIPASQSFMTGLDNITKKFRDWGTGLKSSASFAHFMDGVKAALPSIISLFDNFGTALKKITTAFMPVSAVAISTTSALLALINALPQGALDIIVPVLASLAVGMRAYAIATAVATGAVILFTEAETAADAAAIANPIGLAVAAAAALGVGIAALVNHFHQAAPAIDRTSQSLRDVNEQARGANESLQALADTQLGVNDGQLAVNRAIRAATADLKEHGRQITKNTELGDRQKEIVDSTSKAFLQQAAAIKKTGGDTASIMREGWKETYKQEVAFGASKAAARAYSNSIFGVQNSLNKLPKTKEMSLKLDLSYWTDKLASAKAQLKTVPKSQQATIKAEIANAMYNINAIKGAISGVHSKGVSVTAQVAEALRNVSLLRAYINSVHGKSVTITTYNRMVDQGKAPAYQHYAHGGIIGHAAEGGPRNGMTLVGEHGPELVDLAPGSTVHSAGDSARLMRDSGSPYQLMTTSSGGGSTYHGKTAAVALKQLLDAIDGKITTIRTKFNAVISIIKQKFDGAQEDSLVAYAKRNLAHLEELAKKRDKVATKLADARKYASDLAKSSRDYAGLANLGGADTPMGIKINLEQKLGKMRQFASALKALAKKGLSRVLFQQIAEAGPDAGLELAQNFLAMDTNMFKQVNAIQGQISKAASSIGSNTAEYLFGTKALEKQEVGFQRAMDKAADKFAAKIAAALSKLSGKHNKKASGGIAGGMTWVGEQGPELLDLPYGSSVYSAGDSRRMSSNSGGEIKIQIEWVGGNSDEEFMTWLKRNIRAVSGGGPNSVQTALS